MHVRSILLHPTRFYVAATNMVLCCSTQHDSQLLLPARWSYCCWLQLCRTTPGAPTGELPRVQHFETTPCGPTSAAPGGLCMLHDLRYGAQEVCLEARWFADWSSNTMSKLPLYNQQVGTSFCTCWQRYIEPSPTGSLAE
jgi:hypothetical protein